MPKAKLTPEDVAELNHLMPQYHAAMRHELAVAQTHGLESPEFREAHEKAGRLHRKIRELYGTTGEHWMASDG